MSDTTNTEITRLLQGAGSGDANAAEKLMPLVYAELRQVAGNYLRREHPGHSWDSTELVDEAYLKLVDQTRSRLEGQVSFHCYFRDHHEATVGRSCPQQNA